MNGVTEMNGIITDNDNKLAKLLILDLDNTLIESVDFDQIDFSTLPDDLIRFYIAEFNMMIFVRPKLFKFISRCQDMGYDIGIWSAGVESYVKAITDMLFSHVNTVFRFCRTQCLKLDIDGKQNLTKPLDIIWEKYEKYSANNTVVIDDLKSMYMFNPDNLIEIKPFHYLDINDRELLKLLPLLKTRFVESIQDKNI